MGRKTAGGTAGGSGSLGGIVIDDNTVTVSTPNTTLTLDASNDSDVRVDAPLSITNTTNASSTSIGSLVMTGGMGVGGDIYIGGAINGGLGINNTPVGATTPAAGSFTSLTASGTSTFTSIVEAAPAITGATGTISQDFRTSNIWYYTGLVNNFTVNLTNVPTTNDRKYTISLVLNQGSTGRYASAFQIDGVAQTIRWVNYAPPSVGSNTLDVQTFTLIRAGSAWTVVGSYDVTDNILDGSSAALAAPSAEYLSRVLGFTGKGLYYINTPNGGAVQVFCDLDTPAEDGTSGWMLVASWTGYSWSTATASTRAVIGGTSGSNAWSANFGESRMRYFRVTGNAAVNTTLGSSATGDWYYYFGQTPITWKEVWRWKDGNYNYINDTSGDPNGNTFVKFSSYPGPVNPVGTAVTRISMRGFEHAYNLKFSYKTTTQRWNNFSDSSGAGTEQINCNFWNGLRNPGVSLNMNFNGDGTLAILPQGNTSTTAGHDCSVNQSKVGVDDGSLCYFYGTTATADGGQLGQNFNVPVWFWIK